jgi:hypothetical protein
MVAVSFVCLQCWIYTAGLCYISNKILNVYNVRRSLWSSGQSFWLQIQRSRVRFPALPDFLSSSGSGTGSTKPREPTEVN